MKIVKRNGEVVEFNKTKIEVAIVKAMKYGVGYIEEHIAKQVATQIEDHFKPLETTPTIYDVEKMVFKYLIEFDRMEVARAYEGYRSVQSYKRINKNDKLIQSVIGLVEMTNEDVMSENSNKQAELASTQRDLIAGEVSKIIATNYMIPPHIVQAHEMGAIKIHDLDYYMNGIYNCELVNLEDMLQNGTVINKKTIRKPKSLRTAMTVATQISAQVSSCSYGGQTMTLSHLAPFVRIEKERIERELIEDGLTCDNFDEVVMKRLKREIKHSVQLFNYQISTISGTNGQTPFISLAMYISENPEYEEETAMLIEEFLNQRIEGIENEFGVKTSQTFPKLLYFLDENNAYEGSKYFYLTELSALSTAKRLSPDYISVKVMNELYGTAYPCMGCRAFLTPVQREDGTFDMYGRGNLGVTTISLPHVALTSKGDKDKFFNVLANRMDLAKEMGVLRYDKMKGVKAKTAPILWQYGAIARLNPEDDVIKAINERNFTVTIGYIGLHETVKYMTGHTLIEEEGRAFALEVMRFMDAYKDKIKKETGLLFALYGTPSESTAGQFSDKLQQQFGDIEGITDKGYLINSYHIDIKQHINAFEKLKREQEFAQYSLGGTITYIEIDNMTHNIPAVVQLLQFMYENNIYAEINTESDTCSTCGFDGVMSINDDLKWYCPQCGEKDQDKLSVVRRTCGYISETKWCHSRMLDIVNRVKHL